jgi:hypothetical protein
MSLLEVFGDGDRRDAHVPERTVIGLAHLARVPDVFPGDDVAVVGVGLNVAEAMLRASS